MRVIEGVDGLEQVVGTRVMGSLLKSIDHLDEHCLELLALSPAAVLGYEADGRARAALVGGGPGFGEVPDPSRLVLPLPDPVRPAAGSPVSTVFLVPGLGETLRVNGHVAEVGDGRCTVVVGEAFVHCAKCVLRSKLWSSTDARGVEPRPLPLPADGPLAAPGVAELLAAAPFVVLSTGDAEGAADSSPKGDPPGFVQVLDGSRVAIPDRPGNRRTDTFHTSSSARPSRCSPSSPAGTSSWSCRAPPSSPTTPRCSSRWPSTGARRRSRW